MSRLFKRADLACQGLTRAKIARLIAAGQLQKVSHGWYAAVGADEAEVLAAKIHVRLGCLSAAQFHGLWVPKPRIGFDGLPHPYGKMASYIPTKYGSPTELHVLASDGESVASIQRRVRKVTSGAAKACVHRLPGDKGCLVAPIEDAIEQVARWHDWETALIVIESALNKGAVSKEWVVNMLRRLPKKVSKYLHNFQTCSESGTETRVAHHFRRRGLEVQQQVEITPDIRVDMRVGESLIVETDSRTFHGSDNAYERDRWRASELEKLGYNVVQLSYSQVWNFWEETRQMLNALIGQRKHRCVVQSWPVVDTGWRLS